MRKRRNYSTNGFLNRIFGQKQSDAPSERVNESIATIEKYLRGIVSNYGEANFHNDEEAKQVLSVYSFGGISALAIQHQLSPPQAHAVCLAIFTTFFGFDPADAAAKAQAVITAAPDRTSHLYAIIYRGVDGLLHWQENSDDGAAKDFKAILENIQKVEAPGQ
jgi:Immunity protein 48